ncbi:MAG: winged helix-turn-helix domain-containing protein, partial [Pyrinomonadaceae bacterium]
MSSARNNLHQAARFEIDLAKRFLWVDGRPAELPVKAVELLCVLVEKSGEVASKEELLDRVWTYSFVEEGVLPQNVYLLRRFFQQNGYADDPIQTVPRRGYR